MLTAVRKLRGEERAWLHPEQLSSSASRPRLLLAIAVPSYLGVRDRAAEAAKSASGRRPSTRHTPPTTGARPRHRRELRRPLRGHDDGAPHDRRGPVANRDFHHGADGDVLLPPDAVTGDDHVPGPLSAVWASWICGATLRRCPSSSARTARTGRLDIDGTSGLVEPDVVCQRCGFGFLFELLDDYYPAPEHRALACDREGRILAAGRGRLRADGLPRGRPDGQDVVDAFGLPASRRARARSRSRSSGASGGSARSSKLRSRAGHVKAVTADIFPAYDDDGGLLVAVSPR